jgi:diaminopimelate decarboxylase
MIIQDITISQIERVGFSVNKSGKLTFDQCNLIKLAQKYGTPCYIYSESLIRKKCRKYITAFSKRNIDFESYM